MPADQAVACTLLYIGPGQRLPDELPSRCVALNDGEASARQLAVRGGTVGYGYNRNSMAICVPADLCASDLQIGFAVARQIGSAHVRTPVTNAHHVCRLVLDKN